MAQSGDSGATMYAGLAIVLLIALAALALFKFNLFHVGDMLANSGDDGRAGIHRGGSDDGSADGGTRTPTDNAFDARMPEPGKYYVAHEKPLPERLTIKKEVGGQTIEIEMCLVPQGWFMMGENDGVRSNMPKRWIWLDDYYIARTEMTNTQFYGFILADGYRKSQFWTQEGYEYMTNQVRYRGTSYIGWKPLDRTSHLWGLASPRTNEEETITLEVLEPDGILGVPDCTVLVLPDEANTDYIDYDNVGDQVNVRMKYRETWKDVDGHDVRNDTDHRLKENGLLYFTDKQGRVDLSGIRSSKGYTILAWGKGDKASPILGRLRRSESPYLRDGNMPVVELSWFEADACCRFFKGNLPTEAQWEKAGRGTDGKLFSWGNDLDMTKLVKGDNGTERHSTDFANFNRWRVMPVGSFPDGASEYGVEDLVGNVSEWCRDVYIENPKWDEKNPLSKGNAKERRSERGSSTHDDDPQTAKLHNRRYSDPYARGIDTRGFRLVLDPKTAAELAK
ncbi:MAG: SUMF1/EgtB/PvdO family nonheme iron enzyme [Planctomycetes bacterium]|nr:SUMF1/EgtB/PvdO family nonheme iron enzyme [Planctomycetota bacterium]